MNPPLDRWVTKMAQMYVPIAFITAGCSPAAVIVGGTGAVAGRTLHCYGIGMVNNCPTPSPPEYLATAANDVEKLRALIENDPSIATDKKRLNLVLDTAALSGANAIIRYLIPSRVSPNYPIEYGRRMIDRAATNGHCDTSLLLLDLGATEFMDNILTSVTSGSAHTYRNSDLCIVLAKALIDRGFQPSQKALDEALLWAIEGPPALRGSSLYGDHGRSPPMADFLRSVGAAYSPRGSTSLGIAR